VIEIMQQWNFDVVSQVCCPFHAAVHDVRKCCDKMRRLRCKRNFLPQGLVQCKSCGILSNNDVDDGSPADCETCGQKEGLSVYPRRSAAVASL